VWEVDHPRLERRPPDVVGLERREDLDVALDQVGEPVEQAPAIGRRELRPRPAVELRAGRGDRRVDVGLAGRGDLGDGLLGRGRDDGEGRAVGRVAPLAADEQLGRIGSRSSLKSYMKSAPIFGPSS
jgi:hypothetical protein